MPMSSKRAIASGAALMVMSLLMAGPLQAQTWERRDVHGVVVDGSTGAPVIGAWVRVADGGDGAFTNREGHFVLRNVRIGTVAFEAGLLGYADFAEERVIEAGDGILNISLQPDPVMLEGVQVVADRLAARRNAIPYSVRAYDADRILSTAAGDAYDFVKFSTFTRPCGPSTCIYRRGQVVRPVVFVDETPYYGGLEDLRGLPVEHVYLIEVIGSQVRVYTKTFAERLATRSAPLMPVLFTRGF